MLKIALVAAVFLTAPVLADEAQTFENTVEKQAQPEAQGPAFPRPMLCEGDGCDAYLPAALFTPRYRDEEGTRRRRAVIGAASGAIIGEKIGGFPGAIGLASLGALMGYHQTDRDMEEQARAYHEAWIRGDDITYNPVYPIPMNPQYWGGRRKK